MATGRLLRLLVGAGALMALAGTAIAATNSSSQHAPSARALALAPPLRVISAAAGPDDIQSSLPERYQYMILGAPATQTLSGLVKTEVRFLLAHGWTHAQASVLVTQTRTGTVRIHLVPIGTPGSNVQLDNPRRHIYAAIDMISGHGTADQITDGDPEPVKPIAHALQHHERLLRVVLGNGFHRWAYDGEVFASGS